MTSTNAQMMQAAQTIEKFSRRGFLKVSSVAVAVSAAGMMSVAPTGAFANVPDGIFHMSSDEYLVWHRLMLALLPTKGTTLVDPETLPVLQTVDGAFLATLPAPVLQGLKGGIAFFNQAPIEGFGKPFVELSNAEAAVFCDALASSDEEGPRALFTALKFLTVTSYWAIPPAWVPTGFQGPVSVDWGLDYAGNQPLPTA